MAKFKNISFRYGRRDVRDQERVYDSMPIYMATHTVHRWNSEWKRKFDRIENLLLSFLTRCWRALLPSIDSKKNKGAACDSIHTPADAVI